MGYFLEIRRVFSQDLNSVAKHAVADFQSVYPVP